MAFLFIYSTTSTPNVPLFAKLKSYDHRFFTGAGTLIENPTTLRPLDASYRPVCSSS